ncbi:MAG: cell division protein FtsQ/DivIB [Syntrophothermus sp.]
MSEKKDLSRAEQVRLRRESNRSKRGQRARRDATRLGPPVTSRTRQTDTAPRRKPAQNARRRYQVALPAARSEARPISIPRPRLGIRLVSFLFVLVFAAGIYAAYNLPYFRVTQAHVTGNNIIPAEELSAAMNVAGQPIFLLKSADLETRLRLNYPELASAHVTVSLPNVVSVDVVERKPVVRWEQSGGYTWIAEDGVAFRPRGEIPELISVTAVSAPVLDLRASDPLNPVPFISPEMVQALKGLAGHVPPGVPVLYDPKMGFGWNDPRGWSVYFGTQSNDIELKMRVYETMVNSLTQRGIRPVMINVTYPTAPYYRISQ